MPNGNLGNSLMINNNNYNNSKKNNGNNNEGIINKMRSSSRRRIHLSAHCSYNDDNNSNKNDYDTS